MRLASKVNVARTAESETKNRDQRQFRGEIKPSKHRFSPERERRTSLQVRIREVPN